MHAGQGAPLKPLALGYLIGTLTGMNVTLRGASFLQPFITEQLAKL